MTYCVVRCHRLTSRCVCFFFFLLLLLNCLNDPSNVNVIIIFSLLSNLKWIKFIQVFHNEDLLLTSLQEHSICQTEPAIWGGCRFGSIRRHSGLTNRNKFIIMTCYQEDSTMDDASDRTVLLYGSGRYKRTK